MSDLLHGPRHVVVDHELLERLGAETPRAVWLTTLRRAGLGDLRPQDTAAPALRELLVAMAHWREPDELPPKLTPGGRARVAGGLTLVLALAALPYALQSLLSFLVWLSAVALVVVALRHTQRAPPVEPSGVQARRATEALRRFCATSLVTVSGGAVLESTPHRTWFTRRAEELEAEDRRRRQNIDTLRDTAERIREVNRKLGRPEEDDETAQLAGAIEAELRAQARVRVVADHLQGRREQYEVRLEELRALGERRLLSETVGRLTENVSEHSERAAAQIEVDVLETEREIASLDLKVGEEAARLAVSLELNRR